MFPWKLSNYRIQWMFPESVPHLVWAISRTVQVRLNACKINVTKISFFSSFFCAASFKGEQQSKLFVLLQNPFVSCLKDFVMKISLSFGSHSYCLHALNSKMWSKLGVQKCLWEKLLLALCFHFGEGEVLSVAELFLRRFSKNDTIKVLGPKIMKV